MQGRGACATWGLTVMFPSPRGPAEESSGVLSQYWRAPGRFRDTEGTPQEDSWGLPETLLWWSCSVSAYTCTPLLPTHSLQWT